MADIAHVLVRRAVDVTHAHLKDETRNDDDFVKQTIFAGGIILGITIVLYMAILSAVSVPTAVIFLMLTFHRFLTHTAMLLLLWP